MIGKAVGHYRVLEKLDSDARGVVYKAEGIKLGRRVPLKFLLEELSKDRQALDRFQREARASDPLTHPHIRPISEIGGQGHLDAERTWESSSFPKQRSVPIPTIAAFEIRNLPTCHL